MTANSTTAPSDELNNAGLFKKSLWQVNYQWFTPDEKNQDSNTTYSCYNDPDYAPLVSADPISMNNCVLDIANKRTPSSIHPIDLKDMPYASDRLQAAETFSQLNGCFDSNGVGAAFWLRPQDGSWLPETDAMEGLGEDPSTVHQTIHTGETAANSALPRPCPTAD